MSAHKFPVFKFCALLRLFLIVFGMVAGALSITYSEVVQEWSVWGPGWGRGGLAANGLHYEENLHPNTGDLGYSLQTDRTFAFPWYQNEMSDDLIELLNGRKVLEILLELPSSVEQLRGSDADGWNTLLVWFKRAQGIEITVTSNVVGVVDVIGRSKTIQAEDGKVVILVDSSPQYLRATF